MQDERSHISVPIKGMDTDVHPSKISEDSYEYALNSVVEDFSGNGFPMLQNEASLLPCVNFPSGYKVVGVVNITEQDRKVLFLANPTTGFGQIGEIIGKSDCDDSLVDDDSQVGWCGNCDTVYSPEKSPLELQRITGCCEYIPIATQTCFNFNINHPIRAMYRLEDCGISIYFADNNNFNRYIEFEYTNDDTSQPLKVKDKFRVISGFTPDCNAPIYSNQIDCNKLRIDPVLTIPSLSLIDVVGGGSLKAGGYQFVLAFADKNGNKRTPYFTATNPVNIFTREVTFDTDYQTDRAISMTVSGMQPTSPFEYFNIAVIKTINNVSSFEYVGTFPITSTSLTYTGNEKDLKRLDANDIFEQKIYYAKARGLATSNNYLFWYSPEETKKINIQRIANNIKLYWQTTAIPENAYRNPRVANKYRGYMRDEVYPFGVILVSTNGEETAIGDIPNRIATSDDLQIVNNNDVFNETDCTGCSESSSDVQVHPSPLNTTIFTPSGSSPTLNIDNSHQATSCTNTPYSEGGLTDFSSGTGSMPVIDAGADQTITYDGSISLNGSIIYVNGSVIAQHWYQLSGPNHAHVANTNMLNTYIDGYVAGTYVFQLAVTDANLNRKVDTVTFTVTIPANAAPISNPGSDKIVNVPATTSYLNGASSSDDQGISSYAWTQVSGPNTATIANPAAGYTDISGLIVGVYVFKLTITDTKGCASDANTTIYVVANPCDSVPDPVNLLYPVNGSITSSFSTVILDWDDATCATSYDVYLKKRTDVSYTLVGNTTDSTYILSSLTPNTVYDWYITPKNTHGSAISTSTYYRSFATPTAASVTTCDRHKWQVYNTASIVASPHQTYKDCEDSCWEYGEFAYWESTLTYPNIPEIWGDLCGKPIRHHKFPDSLVTHIHDGLNASTDNSRDNFIFPIGVKIDHNSVVSAINQAVTDGIITEEDRNNIAGYRLVRGNRFGNKSIQAKGLLYDMNHYRRKLNGDYFDNQTIYFANYPYNDLRTNPFVTDDFRNYDEHNTEKGSDLPFIFSKRYTFHGPDTHFSEPTIGAKLKLETAEYGVSEGYFTVSKRQAKQKFLSNASYTIAFAAGIVAALTKTEEKEIKQYTVKGSVVSGMGLASGVFGPFLPYQTGTGAAIVPESIVDTTVNAQRAASINAATEVTTQTIQGKQKDWLNPVYLALKKPILLPLLPIILVNAVSGFLSTVLYESGIVLDLIRSLTPYRDWCIQYNSVGKYNSYKTIPNTGNKLRHIDSWRYLKGENAYISEPSELDATKFSSIKVNNWHRETSLYLRYSGVDFPNVGAFSGITDTSRITFEDSSVGKSLDKRVQQPISSYYASLKSYVPDQYGSIYNIDYVSTESRVFALGTPNTDCNTVFGGDTFINRFSLKRKVPYFLADTFEMQNGTDFDFSSFPNLGVPRHYYNSTTGIASEFDSIGDLLTLFTPEGIGNFLGRPKSIRDASTNKFFYQNGYIYLHHYGIPYFLVESDENLDLRYAENMQDKAFYPVQSDLDFWLQEENVRLREPNYYFYNNSYSKQNKEHAYYINPPDFQPARNCRVAHPNRIIYSNGANWLVYKPNDYYDFPLASGRVVGVDGIENDKVLVRSENTAQVFNAYITIPTNTQNIQVGTGGMFQSKPQEYSHTSLGYSGAQHSAILHTEFGHVWVDAKRGQIFNLSGQGMDEISRYGKKNWFKENLPFHIIKDFPALTSDDVDNNFKGIGLALAFDKRFARILITKLDYKLLDNSITYNTSTKKFMKGSTEVLLTNPKYFCNKSWTMSYSFWTKSWVSYHSYLPNYYIESINYFSSGWTDDSSLWLHNATNKSYQVFKGKIHPWIVQPVTKADTSKDLLTSVEFGLDAIRYHKEFDPFYTTNISFNKAIISNQNQSSGLLELDFKTKSNLSALLIYPITNANSTTIRITNSDGIWRFNQFYDLAQSRQSNIPLWISNCANSERSPNIKAFNYQIPDLNKKRIRGEWNRITLINDKHTKYKMIFKWEQNNAVKTYR